MYLYYRCSADPQRHGPSDEEMDAMREHWLTQIHEGLVALADAWRCQVGDDRFKWHCVEAQARRITHPDWPWVDHDMRVEEGHREWWLHMRGPQYGPRLPYGHPIKRQEVDDELPF